MDEPTSGLLDIRDLPELQRARTLWVNQHWDRAEAEFCRIADSHPSNWHALLDAARVLGDRQEIRRSRALLDRLISLAADREDLLLQVAQTCRMSRREPAALELLQRYTARGPGRHDPAGHLELAVLYERQQQLDEAEASAQAALKAAPHWMEALIILARVRRQRGETIRAEAALQRVIRAPRVADSTRSQAWAMWADMADRSGHPAVAIDRLERAKDLMRPAAGGLADHGLRILRAWERVARQCAPETLARWQAAGSPATDRHPIPAHLLGFPRSGTTLLENILEAHSRLVSSEESQVLGRDLLGVLWRAPEEDIPPTVAALESVPPGKLGALRRRYWERMAEGLGLDEWPSVHLDKNPTHTLFIPAILRLLPDSRFLVALRDPRDVVVSCYFQWFPLNSNSASFLSWQRAVDRYLLDMGAWLLLREKLPPATWLEVRYEDVVADFAGQARRALDFLDLSWEDGVLDYRNHLATKAVHTPSYLEIRRPVHAAAVGRWKKYARWMEPHINRLRPLVEALGYAW